VGKRKRGSRRPLIVQLCVVRPDVQDPAATIAAGHVMVDGAIVTNPASLVRRDAAIVVRAPLALRGEAKLRAALVAFELPVRDRVALDLGAAAGGFTRVLLEAGARRVYAVDAGHGQLLGSLRQDPRVVNLEATNLARLDRRLVPEIVDLVTMDLSYVAAPSAVGQLGAIGLARAADLVVLVKPMFELRLARAPTDPGTLIAAAGVERAGWGVRGRIDSPAPGARGALEMLLHGRRRP
jgi:23S rRNA (cytidine1920-2'-O)/16S rRNA (cytidine1409-2'-O)-methyltransferase